MCKTACPKTTVRTGGFSVLEVILAAALFIIFSVGAVSLIVQATTSNRIATEMIVAKQFASEGIEAVKSIKNQSYSNLVNTAGSGVVISGGVWDFNGVNNVFDTKYTRVITVSDVNRDGSGNIVSSGGTLDSGTKKITSTVSWPVPGGRTDSVALSTYLTNWEAPIAKGGILVYANGGTTSDSVMYKTLDATSGLWSSASSVADIDGATTNKHLRAVGVYSSATRNEKVMISRHYNGSSQFIYAQVFDGLTWGDVTLLSSWAATTHLNVQNFDGDYLANGDFMVVYSDNSTTPKFKVWDGAVWGSQVSMQVSGGIPNYIAASTRPGTDEMMVALFDQSSDTNSEYFNGGSYATGSWTIHTEHSTTAPANTKKFVDFSWSTNTTTKGAMVYANGASDKSINVKIFTANGTGGGSWTATSDTSVQVSNLGALSISPRSIAQEFIACDKDAAATPAVICYNSNFTPSWTNPTNPTIASATVTGIQRSFDISFETSSGDPAIAVYSDNTAVPKLKKYTASTSTWDSSATSISTSPFSLGVVNSVTLVSSDGDDIMVLMGDASLDLYSVIWDGSTDTMYSAPAGKAFSRHGTSGTLVASYWFDFAWDEN